MFAIDDTAVQRGRRFIEYDIGGNKTAENDK